MERFPKFPYIKSRGSRYQCSSKNERNKTTYVSLFNLGKTRGETERIGYLHKELNGRTEMERIEKSMFTYVLCEPLTFRSTL